MLSEFELNVADAGFRDVCKRRFIISKGLGQECGLISDERVR